MPPVRPCTALDSVTPMVVVLTLSDGKVIEHRDYVDYAPFLGAVREVRAGGQGWLLAAGELSEDQLADWFRQRLCAV